MTEAKTAALDPRIDSLYSELADLDDRWDMTEAQKITARTHLLWSVVVIKRRRTSLLANGGLLNALLSTAAAVKPAKRKITRQQFGLD